MECVQYCSQKYDLPVPKVMDIRGFGALISSGLTNARARLNEDAFSAR